MLPVADPPFAESAAVALNMAAAAQVLKSMVMFAVALPAGAMLPTTRGNFNGPVIVGVQAAPVDCASVKLVISAVCAVDALLVAILSVHTLALAGPALPVILPASVTPVLPAA